MNGSPENPPNISPSSEQPKKMNLPEELVIGVVNNMAEGNFREAYEELRTFMNQGKGMADLLKRVKMCQEAAIRGFEEYVKKNPNCKNYDHIDKEGLWMQFSIVASGINIDEAGIGTFEKFSKRFFGEDKTEK